MHKEGKLQAKKPRVVVLMGGWSREREVSLRSGNKVLSALQSLGYPAFGLDPKEAFPKLLSLTPDTVDKVFIALHGQYGEDGTIQGLLELLHLPYTGSKVAASAVAMNPPKPLPRISVCCGKRSTESKPAMQSA